MKGFTLIEVLVALLILSLGLLGIAGMQLSAVRYGEEAYWQTLAATQAASFLECLRVNRLGAARQKELERWNALNARLLPQGKGRYGCNKGVCEVGVSWHTKQAHHFLLTGTP